MSSWPGRVARDGSTAVAAGLIVLGGVWVAGAVVTDDATTAKMLTGGWFAATGAAAVVLARSRRVPTVAVFAGWFVTTSIVGGYLFITSTVDRVVHEQVVVADSDSGRTTTKRAAPTATLEATGEFRSDAHETRGTASLVRVADGRRLLTLTGFSTAPGPDLRVLVVPDRTGIDDAVDLGGLRGNKGDQQYVVPPTTRVGSVVVWCRAFSVSFGSALLRSPA